MGHREPGAARLTLTATWQGRPSKQGMLRWPLASRCTASMLLHCQRFVRAMRWYHPSLLHACACCLHASGGRRMLTSAALVLRVYLQRSTLELRKLGFRLCVQPHNSGASHGWHPVR